MKFIKDLGMLYATPTSKHKVRFGLYECPICLKPFNTTTSSVKRGHSTKCKRCSTRIKKTKHGHSSTRLYSSWSHIISRCTKVKNKDYKDYGERGITVCNEWINDL